MDVTRTVAYGSFFALMLVLLLAAAISSAETTVNFSCVYDRYAKDGELGEEDFKLDFIIDTDSSKAYMVGNQGSTEVLPVNGVDTMSFIEITESGNVMTTAITKQGETVHSRNTYLFDHFAAAQYYGTCKIR